MVGVGVPALLRQAVLQKRPSASKNAAVIDVFRRDLCTEIPEQRSGGRQVDFSARLPQVVSEDVILGQFQWSGHSEPSADPEIRLKLTLSKGNSLNTVRGSISKYPLSFFVLRGPMTLQVQILRLLSVF